jgi:hypothetical protein
MSIGLPSTLMEGALLALLALLVGPLPVVIVEMAARVLPPLPLEVMLDPERLARATVVLLVLALALPVVATLLAEMAIAGMAAQETAQLPPMEPPAAERAAMPEVLAQGMPLLAGKKYSVQKHLTTTQAKKPHKPTKTGLFSKF